MNKNSMKVYSILLVLFSFVHIVPSTNYLTPVAGSPVQSGGVYPYFSSYSPDNKWLAAANYDSNTVSMLSVDPNTGVLTQVDGSPFSLPGLSTPYAMTFSPIISGSYFLAVTNFGTNRVSVFPVNSDGTLATQVTGSPFACGSDPYGIAYSPNSKWFATANNGDNTVSVYSVTQTGAAVGQLTPVAGSPFNLGGILDEPTSVSYSPDNKYLTIACYGNNTLVVCSVNQTTGVIAHIQTVASVNTSYFVTYSPDGKWLAASSYGGQQVYVFGVNFDGTLSAVAGSPFKCSSQASGLSYSPNSEYLSVAGNDNTVNVFSVNADGSLTFVPPLVYTGENYDYAWSMAYSANGQWLAVSNPYSYSVSEFTTLSTDPFVRALEIKYWPLLNS